MAKTRTAERVVYQLTVDLPPGVSCTRFTQYIHAALRSHCGGVDPTDPIFDFKPADEGLKVKVKERHVRYTT